MSADENATRASEPNADALYELERWYRRRCDGEWEHEHGIRIDTLDNPGWRVDVDLAGTPLAGRAYERIEHRSENDWIDCRVVGDEFNGRGGSMNLREIVTTFLAFAQQVEPRS
jgi:hypothetical protein